MPLGLDNLVNFKYLIKSDCNSNNENVYWWLEMAL